MTQPDPQQSVVWQAPSPVVTHRTSRAARLVRNVLTYSPTPLAAPKVDPGFLAMSLPLRALESLRYAAALLEYRAGPSGWVRAWSLLWFRVFLVLAIPAAALGLVVVAAAPLFARLATIAACVEQIARYAFSAVCWTAATAFVLAVTVAFLKSRPRR